MNIKRTLTGILAIAALLLAACGDDDKPSPKEQFTFGDETITLKDANLFLMDDENFHGDEDGNFRRYIITDGQSNGSGATFYIEIELGNPTDDAVEAGTYPVFYDWFGTPENTNVSWVYSEMGEDDEYVELYTMDGADGDDEVIISGGMDDGETMTLKFNGTLMMYHFNGTDWVDEEITGKFNFKGEVEDVTSSPARVSSFAHRERRAH